jgi:hypothetical protein
MSDYIPLIVNVGTGQIQELPSSDNLDLTNNNIVNAIDITANGITTVGTIKTDNYQFANGSPLTLPAVPGGSDTQFQYNNVGVLDGQSYLTFDLANSFINITNVSNLKMPGGAANDVLLTDGTGNLSFGTAPLGGTAIANIDMATYNLQLSTFNEIANTTAQVINTGDTPTFDAINGTIQQYTVNDNFDFGSADISNVAQGGSIVMIMNINAAAKSMGTTTDIIWAGGDKTFSVTSGTKDMICLLKIDSTTYYGTLTKGYA